MKKPIKPRLIAPQIEGVKISTAFELQKIKFPPIRYVVENYVSEGLTLFAGRPKIGKSWMAMEKGIGVSKGGTCLGNIECEQGDVLYLALEDNPRRLQNRFNTLLKDEPFPKSFHYATSWPRGIDAIKPLRTWIEKVENPTLIIIDVLAKIRAVTSNEATIYDRDYAALSELQNLAIKEEVAIEVLHHTRKQKDGNDSDPIDKISGTLGLSGAADTILVIDRDAQGTTLYARGRDIEEIESAVEFNPLTCKWKVLGDAHEVRLSNERRKVKEVLKGSNEPMSPKEISAITGLTEGATRKMLHKMMKDGQVNKVERGRYVYR